LKLLRSRLLGVVLIVVLLGLWEIITDTKIVHSPSLPPVSAILVDWVRLLLNGTLVAQLGPSIERIAFGYVAAVIVGVTIGLAMGYYRIAYDLLEPLTELLRPIPSPAYIPLAIIFLGLGDEMKIFVVFFACIFPILLNTYSGVSAIDPVQLNTARTFRLTRAQTVRKIVLPAALPSILTGMRISVGLALIVVVIAEMVASNTGIGAFILNAQRFFNVTDMYAGIFTLALLGYALNALFLRAEAHLLRYRAR
jgi:ABC-type nitrate/sulfonate/bicarbonate transport system permease component